MSHPVPFCTCKDTSCPLNPVNHDQGCVPCVAKCLKERELPSCFFHIVDCPKPTAGWGFEDFAALVEADRQRRKS